MKKIDIKETLKVTGILFAICVVVSMLLGATYIITYEPILAAQEAQAAAMRLEVLPADDYVRADCEEDVYLAVADGKVIGCVITTSAKGYGGDIGVMTGISFAGDVTGVSILTISETPGVGMKVNDKAHLSQYITATYGDAAADALPSEPWAPVDSFTLGGKVDAITGATISSNAVNNAVNEALSIYARLIEQGALVLPEDYVVSAPSDTDLPETPTDTAPQPEEDPEVIVIE